jgi:hypothetical protein
MDAEPPRLKTRNAGTIESRVCGRRTCRRSAAPTERGGERRGADATRTGRFSHATRGQVRPLTWPRPNREISRLHGRLPDGTARATSGPFTVSRTRSRGWFCGPYPTMGPSDSGMAKTAPGTRDRGRRRTDDQLLGLCQRETGRCAVARDLTRERAPSSRRRDTSHRRNTAGAAFPPT